MIAIRATYRATKLLAISSIVAACVLSASIAQGDGDDAQQAKIVPRWLSEGAKSIAAVNTSWYEAIRENESVKKTIEGGEATYHNLVNGTKTVERAAPIDKIVDRVVDRDVTVPSNVIYVRFSKPFLETYFCKQFERTLPVNDTMLGATVSGTSRTLARTEIGLVDNPDEAQAKLFFKGDTSFWTTSRSGPISINSQGTTRFTSSKKLWFDGSAIQQSKPVSSAKTTTNTTGISTSLPRLRGRISLRIANEQLAQNRSTAENITAERTKRKIEQAFDNVIKERTVAFTEELMSQYAKLPLDGRFAIQDIQCSTTPQSLQIVVMGRGDKEPSYAAAPVPLEDHPDIEVHIHTTLLKKALVEPDLRKTLQAAVKGVVDRPLIKAIAAKNKPQAPPQPEREFKIHWLEGENLEWLSLAWHAKEKPEATTPAKDRNQTTETRRPAGPIALPDQPVKKR